MMFANAGVIYKALGIPVNSFTVMFAMGLRGHVCWHSSRSRAHWTDLKSTRESIPECKLGA